MIGHSKDKIVLIFKVGHKSEKGAPVRTLCFSLFIGHISNMNVSDCTHFINKLCCVPFSLSILTQNFTGLHAVMIYVHRLLIFFQ